MLTVLLIIIYISFISLGLPDAIMGAAWPVMHQELNVPVAFAGIETIIVSGGTIISSFFSGWAIKKFGTGKVTAFSVFLTAVGLCGTYMAPSFFWICVLGIPLGIGAGAVDSALNNFVALRYEAKHMNWLHCFWGIGATTGPLIMSFYLMKNNGWRLGYLSIGILQMVLVIALVVTLPLWKKVEKGCEEAGDEQKNHIHLKQLLGLPGAKSALIAFLCYCAAELTTGLWISSFLVIVKGIPVETAAQWVSVYYLGITIGRLIAGFVAIKLNNKMLIRIGQSICMVGVILIMFPLPSVVQFVAVILIGLGYAPIYPAMLHETPNRFGKEASQGIMGIQMATAYIGSTLVPPMFGVVSKVVGFDVLPGFLLGVILIMVIATESVNKRLC